MKRKMTAVIVILMLLTFTIGNAKWFNFGGNKKSKEDRKYETQQKKEQNKFEKAMKSFELEATIKTTKGNISVFLYPEAAPKNVANFVFLAKNNFYNGLTFHRVVNNVLVQGGDPNGDGTGSAGYNLDDEIVKWLNFDSGGVMAMANSGPNTNGSQFFITVGALPSLNDKYTIIGETKTGNDLSVLKLIRPDDKIIDIEIRGRKVDDFLSYFPVEVNQWQNASGISPVLESLEY